jgi:hypothetical protein
MKDSIGMSLDEEERRGEKRREEKRREEKRRDLAKKKRLMSKFSQNCDEYQVHTYRY